MEKTCCVILAGGAGKRMISRNPKVISQILFEPIIDWVLSSIIKCNIKNICVITGFMNKLVEKSIIDSGYHQCEFILQRERKGTAHAVMMSEKFLNEHFEKNVLILNGDSPFIDKTTILGAYKLHKKLNNAATVISSALENPFGYGRIIRDNITNEVKAIVEEREASAREKTIKEVNSGAYWFKVKYLLKYIHKISNNTSQKEYYLTDLIKLFIENNLKINAFKVLDSTVIMGANDCHQLKMLNEIARKRIIEKHIKNGLNIPCHDGVIIGKNVDIKEGATILPNTILYGTTSIGKNCIIGPNSQVKNCIINDDVVINSSYCENSFILQGEKIGPFASVINIKKLTLVENAAFFS